MQSQLEESSNLRSRTKSQSDFQDIEYQQQQSPTIQVKITNFLQNAYTSSVRIITEVATNIAYNARNSSIPFINRKQIILTGGCESAVMLGKKYQFSQMEDFLNDFNSVIWICYRRKNQEHEGDVGWGCMIRVCQMVFAQSLRRAYSNMHNSEIIKQFSLAKQALFSFDKICMEGKIMKRWTSSAEIMIALDSLLKEQDKYKIKIEVYHTLISINDVSTEDSYPMLLVVNNRVGPHKIERRMKDHIEFLLGYKFSVGMISGIGGEAIYVIGFHQGYLIHLDPHYVQPQVLGEKQYYNHTPRGIQLQKVVPSVGMCFYLNSSEQHKQLIDDLAESWYFHTPNVVIQSQGKYSEKIYHERHPLIIDNENDSQQFQIL